MKSPSTRMLVLVALVAVPVLLAIFSQTLAERPGAPTVDPNPVVISVQPTSPPTQPGSVPPAGPARPSDG